MASLNRVQNVALRSTGSNLLSLGGLDARAAVVASLAFGLSTREQAASISPTTQNFNGYWRAAYSGAPWTPTASAGFSGINGNLDDATPATVGASSNGFASADFNGSTRTLTTQSVVKADLFQNNAGTIGVLVNPRSLTAPNVNTFADVRLFGDTGANFGLMISSAGIKGAIFDGTSWVYTPAIPVPLNAYAFCQMRWDGTVLSIRINDGVWATVSCTGIDPGAGSTTLQIGGNFGASAFLDGTVLEIMAANVVHSTATLDGIWAYAQARYFSSSLSAIAGTTSLSFGQAGTLAARATCVGTAASTFGQSGTLAGRGTCVGTAALAMNASASGAAALAAITATCALSFGQTGTLLGAGALVGTSPLTFGQSGTLAGAGTLVGTAAATLGQTGTLLALVPITASAGLTFGQSGSALGRGALVGSSAIVVSQTGTVLGVGSLVGSAAATFGQTGTCAGAGALVGACTATFGQSGTLAGSASLAGTCAATFGQVGNITSSGGPAGAIAGTCALSFGQSGTLAGRAACVGTAALLVGQSGTALGRAALVGSAPLAVNAQGSISARVLLTGTIGFVVSVNGTLSALFPGRLFVQMGSRPMASTVLGDRPMASTALSKRALGAVTLAAS